MRIVRYEYMSELYAGLLLIERYGDNFPVRVIKDSQNYD